MKKTLRASNKEARSQPEELLPATEGVSSGMAPIVKGEKETEGIIIYIYIYILIDICTVGRI